VAIEDQNFFHHQGFDLRGLARAIFQNVKYVFCQLTNIDCQLSFQGGSTITQQLIKNTLLTPERTPKRKIQELILSLFTEIRYSKNQILEMYLNQVPYGGTAYGIQAAAQAYFNKSAPELSLSEAALLAGLPRAPTLYSPFGAHPELAKTRQVQVLDRMLQDGYISDDQRNQAANAPLDYSSPQGLIHAPHFALWIKQLLVEKFDQKTVEQGGLQVTTTLDLDLQNFTQGVVTEEISQLEKEQVSNGAALITEPSTGQILALVGSADYFNPDIDGQVNLTLRPRQPGSSIKPLNYTLALQQGLISPASVIADVPTCFNVIGQESYCPRNYDNQFHGLVSARSALANSYNLPAVKVLAKNSVKNFINFATQLGITTWQDPSHYGLSLTLGGGEVTMLDMATAFAVLANSGVKVNLNPILEITDSQNHILESSHCEALLSTKNIMTPSDLSSDLSSEALALEEALTQENVPSCGQQVIDPRAPFLTTHILTDRGARAPMFGSGLNIPNHPEVAVKTGTTNDKRDNWTIGYTRDRLVTVWVGNNDNSPMSRVASGITGASPIWVELMTKSLEQFESYQLSPPEDVIGTQICPTTGQLPNENCPGVFDLFLKENLPTDSPSLTRPWPIDKTLGQPATDQTLPELVEMQDHPVAFDILGTAFCLDCPIPERPISITYPLK
jgi:penicillin-binding protein 1C